MNVTHQSSLIGAIPEAILISSKRLAVSVTRGVSRSGTCASHQTCIKPQTIEIY